MQIRYSAPLAFVVFLSLPIPAIAQQLYKHVDANGKVTFSDRPQQAGDKQEEVHTPNVATPEERQQMYEEKCRNREAKREDRYGQARSRREREREEAAYVACMDRQGGGAAR